MYTGAVPANIVAHLAAWVIGLAQRSKVVRGKLHIVTAPAPADRRWAFESLTARELEIAERIARGEPVADIAAALSISHYTVETHLKHIYSKLDVHSRIQLARALRGFVDE